MRHPEQSRGARSGGEARTRAVRCLAALTIGLLHAAGTSGAQEVVLRYRPGRIGTQMKLVVWTDATSTIVAGEAASEAITLEFSGLTGLTHRLRAVRGDTSVIAVSWDSVRLQMRPLGEPWRELPDSRRTARTAELTVNRLLAITAMDAPGMHPTADRNALQWFRGLAGGYEIVLPEEPVSPGTTWQGVIYAPVDPAMVPVSELQIDPGLVEIARLAAHVVFTADSVVPRGADTLVVIGLGGPLAPLSLASPAEVSAGTVTVTGALSGTLMWSTGWNGFVAGGVRSVTEARLRPPGVEPVPPPSVTVRADVTRRFQLRP